MIPTHLYTYKIHWPFYERCFTSIVNLIFDIKLTFMKWIAVFIQYYVYVENALNYFIKKYLKIIIFLQDVPSKRSVLINISLDGIKVCCPKGQVIGICLKQPDLLKIFELFFRTLCFDGLYVLAAQTSVGQTGPKFKTVRIRI